MSVFPVNSDDDVKRFARIYGIQDLSQEFTWILREGAKASPLPFETPITIYESIKRFCDLRSFPTKLLLKKLLKLSSDPKDIEEL